MTLVFSFSFLILLLHYLGKFKVLSERAVGKWR